MKQSTIAVMMILVSLIGILVVNGVYIVDEAEQIVVTQFGDPVGQPIKEPGLHLKTPFIQEINRFDKRILNWDGYPSEVPTRDKKFIGVDTTGRWRIENALTFLQTMHNERNAQSRLDDIMDGVTRNFITRYDLAEMVRSTNDVLNAVVENVENPNIETEYEKITVGRDEITRQILESAKVVVKEYGIELIDLRIKRINYIESVQRKVYDRMISERNRAAEQMRSEGQGLRAEIEGRKGKELKRITSEAYKMAQSLKGEADAKATAIYGNAFSQDPDFYAYMTTLEKYPNALANSRVVLTTDSDFLKYLKKAE